LGQEKSGDDEEQRADNVAELELRNLRDVLAKQDGDLAEKKEQTHGLHEVHDMAGYPAPGSEGKITVVSRGKFIGVDAEENVPDKVATIACHEPKYGEKRDSRAITKSADCKWNGKWAKDIGGDLTHVNSRAKMVTKGLRGRRRRPMMPCA